MLIPFFVWSQSNFEKADKLFHAKKYKEAEVVFQENLKYYPNDIKTLERLAEITSEEKEWEKAASYYKKLKQLKPNEADYFYKYGGCLGMRALEVNKFKAFGMVDDMKASFEKAIVLNPKHIQARWALIELYLQLPGIVGGSESKALRYSNELAKLSPVDGYMSKGRIDEYFKRYASAEKNYIKAHEIGNSKVTFQKLYNLYLNKLKEPKKAQELKRKFDS
jgi:protein involved in temperature-dependent protein secretion